MARTRVFSVALLYVHVVQEDQLRSGAEYFTQPGGAGQRRYEALRAYFVEEASAAEIADRFGYSTASVHQMATLLRTGKLALFAEAKPGPKGPRKATGALREKVLALRAGGRSIGEIAAALAEAGTPVSAQTVWQILDEAGLPRLPRRDDDPPRQPRRAGPGQGRSADRLATRAADPVRPRRTAAAVAGDGAAGPGRPGRPGRLPSHLGDHRLAVDRHPAAGQVRPRRPRPPHRRAHRRRRARPRAAA